MKCVMRWVWSAYCRNSGELESARDSGDPSWKRRYLSLGSEWVSGFWYAEKVDDLIPGWRLRKGQQQESMECAQGITWKDWRRWDGEGSYNQVIHTDWTTIPIAPLSMPWTDGQSLWSCVSKPLLHRVTVRLEFLSGAHTLRRALLLSTQHEPP